MIACGTLALFAAGGINWWLAILFTLALAGSWKLEDTKHQLSERVALLIVLASLPFFYFDWRYQFGGPASPTDWIGVGALTHLILFLSVMKLVQVKADRDWLFLYLISFFEVLLAAGLSISPLFLLTLCLYTCCALSTIICFEIQRAKRAAGVGEVRQFVVLESSRMRRRLRIGERLKLSESRPFPLITLVLLAFILILALPIFLIAPRYAGGALARSGEGLSGFVGFSDRVSLGKIGELQQSDRVVMRVRLEPAAASPNQRLYWRGVALDNFDGRDWRKSLRDLENVPLSGGLYKLDSTVSLDRLTTQTFYLEPVDTPVLFVAASAIALQGGSLPYVRKDRENGLSTRDHSLERITYRAYSDTLEPPVELLRADRLNYEKQAVARYLQLPDNLDERVGALARDVVRQSGAQNGYDQARVLEKYLQENFGYTLNLRAGGADPVASFLFDVQEGHCEYFSTSLALMLRTQGIASRVVNGFQMGDYNDAADAYTVKQLHAHSWVEAYFPATQAWVTFDPTPAEGIFTGEAGGGLQGRIKKYAEAFELLWIQYVVAFDRQEQQSLAGSLRNRFGNYQRAAMQSADDFRARLLLWWEKNKLSRAAGASVSPSIMRGAIGLALLGGAVLIFLFARRWRRFGWRAGLKFWNRARPEASIVAFYERLTRALAARGFRRAPAETPLEFARAVNLPEAVLITNAYNQVRYGARRLTTQEVKRIEEFLRALEVK